MDDFNKSILPKRDLVDEIIRHQMASTDVRDLIHNWAPNEKEQLAEGLAGTFNKLARVMEVTRELATTLDINRLLPRMVALFCEIMHTERATIFLFHEESQELVSGTAEGHTRVGDLVIPAIRVPVSEGLAGKVFRTGESLISEAPYDDDDFYRKVDDEHGFVTRNILCVPLRDGDERSIGVVEVLNKTEGQFNPLDLHLLEALAHQVCAVFINAKLHDAISRARDEEAQLLELTTAMSQELQLVPLLHTIMTTVTNILGADRSTLFMYDEKSGDLWSHVAQGLGDEIRVPATKGIAGHVLTSGEVINIPDAYADGRFNPEVDKKTGYLTNNILCMPVRNKKGKTIGVIQALNKRAGPFNTMDERRLQAFAAQASIAIENATLFEGIMDVKNHNERLLESMSNGLLTIDPEGRIASANMAALRIFRAELKTEKVLNRNYLDFFGPDNDWVIQMVKKVTRTKTQDIALNSELILIKKGDVVEHERRRKFATVNLTAIPLQNPTKKELMGCMLVIEDITTEKSLRRTMARYLPKEVTDKVLADDTDSLGGKMQKASVLFSDIRAFTQISAEIGPQETVSMLNDYFSTMVEVISEHGGMLDKYIGDALMAVFGVPYLQHDDANRALVSGLRMLDGLERFNRTWVPKGNKPIKIGIGLNTDLVLSGNIGSPKRMDFTVIGDGVNVAAKLEAANKFYGTKMLITEFTKAALTEDVPLREVDRVLVKGRSDALTIFEPLDSIPTSERETLNTLLGPYTEGLEFYRNRNWGLAFQAFEAARQIKKDDRLTQVYLDRCAQHIHKPPSDDWNGVYSLMEK